MPFRNLTIDQLARHIGMDAREVRRLADRGQLPGQLVGGQWRFNQAAMLDWLQREMHSLGEEHLRNLEKAMSDDPDRAPLLGELIPTEAVEIFLPARSRASVLRELVNLVERTGMLYDADALHTALAEREELCSTGLAGGFAFPHPRRPLPLATAEPLVCIARVPAGIAFGAPDGRMTDLFVLVCAHDERRHLQILARLGLLFSHDLPERLRTAESNAAALEALLDVESHFVTTNR
ncbi:MAG: PTS sugar transporter subunit IIA [Phycisphaerales bacterium]|nr:PTS sugar transporter subunit IIA [Phycisphaerales bacterium]